MTALLKAELKRWRLVRGDRHRWLIRDPKDGRRQVAVSLGIFLLRIALPLSIEASGWTAWPWPERTGTLFVSVLCFGVKIDVRLKGATT
ncbi:MAG TPA: hypothetical protein VMY76_00605 [Gemmatimonadales bacterium]|nr:hypothetical protein [Gemmatimonadales bacterium]